VPGGLVWAGLVVMGLLQLDGYDCGDRGRSGELELVIYGFGAQLQSRYLCYPSRENRPLRVRAFIDFVVARFKRDCFIL